MRESERERQRYQNEANRIREMMQRNVMSTRHAAQIGNYYINTNDGASVDNSLKAIMLTNC